MTQTPQELTKPFRLLTEWIAEKERYLSILIESMGYQKKWSECDDPAKVEYYTPEYLLTKEKVETLQQEIAECRNALQAHDREQQLKEAIQAAHQSLTWCNTDKQIPHAVWHLEQALSLYPDTPAPTPEINRADAARSIDEWHEDYGAVLWWEFPIVEPPFCGTPLDRDWPGYHTYWTPLVLPAVPAPKEGE